jgi:hypothetical protein
MATIQKALDELMRLHGAADSVGEHAVRGPWLRGLWHVYGDEVRTQEDPEHNWPNGCFLLETGGFEGLAQAVAAYHNAIPTLVEEIRLLKEALVLSVGGHTQDEVKRGGLEPDNGSPFSRACHLLRDGRELGKP